MFIKKKRLYLFIYGDYFHGYTYKLFKAKDRTQAIFMNILKNNKSPIDIIEMKVIK